MLDEQACVAWTEPGPNQLGSERGHFFYTLMILINLQSVLLYYSFFLYIKLGATLATQIMGIIFALSFMSTSAVYWRIRSNFRCYDDDDDYYYYDNYYGKCMTYICYMHLYLLMSVFTILFTSYCNKRIGLLETKIKDKSRVLVC